VGGCGCRAGRRASGFDTVGHLGLIYLATAVFVVGAVLALKALLETGS
jgi:hypothetical protein